MKRVVMAALLAVACGGETGSDSNPSTGGASAGGSSTGGAATGGSSTGGGGGLSIGGSSSGGASSGGASSGGAGTCGPIDPGTPCSTLVEAQCLAAHPRCVPLYDDQCCPVCEPAAPCADCVNMQFIGCTDMAASNCVPGSNGPCGLTPDWACSGGSATCPTSGPCNTTAGCIEAKIAGCGDECPTECHPLTGATCFTPCAVDETPYCGSDAKPEGSVNGYTGSCVDYAVCGCPATPPQHASTCTLEGIQCNYGKCQPHCTCTAGVWSCYSNPC